MFKIFFKLVEVIGAELFYGFGKRLKSMFKKIGFILIVIMKQYFIDLK